jgi:hypothetical protein
VESLSEADIYSDHNSLVTKICTRLKKIIMFQKRIPRSIWRSYTSNNIKCVAASGNKPQILEVFFAPISIYSVKLNVPEETHINLSPFLSDVNSISVI